MPALDYVEGFMLNDENILCVIVHLIWRTYNVDSTWELGNIFSSVFRNGKVCCMSSPALHKLFTVCLRHVNKYIF